MKIFDYYAGKPEPIFLMSCTKSITALAVGEAIAEGKIKSIDEPVYDFYPEWKQGKKRLITIRQLLTMTSGLQNTGRGDEVYDAPDSVKLALAAELYTPPGAAFTYNNKSVNLLSGIIHVATGQPLDDYVRDHFFTPMGIKSWQWTRDDAGNPYAMAELVLYPEDFAKFGTLVLQKGQWNGKQLVPTVWIEQIGLQSQPYEPDYGLLWWRAPTSAIGVVTPKRVAEIAAGGASPAFVKQLATLENKPMHSMTEWHQRLAAVTPDWEKATYLPEVIGSHATDIPTWTYAGFDGVAAEGYLGQYLVVFPKLGLVGVRMIKPPRRLRLQSKPL